MTYAEFLLIFLVLPTTLLIGAAHHLRRRGGLKEADLKYHWLGVGILAFIAFVWTTPWDNYLIAKGVWDSPPDRILFRIGYVPIEEYAFFVLMPVFNGALLCLLFNQRRFRPTKSTWREKQTRARGLLLLFGALLMFAGWWLLKDASGSYLGLIIVWFTPPLMIQWNFDPAGLFQGRSIVAAGTLLPLLYFALVDSLAIQLGIWEISPAHTTGLGLPNLPIEEFIFFAVTSLLLAQGMALWHSLKPMGSRL